MLRHPEASDKKRSDACGKKKSCPDKKDEFHSLSAATHGVPIPRSILATKVENAIRPSLDDALANLSNGRSRLFHHQPLTKHWI